MSYKITISLFLLVVLFIFTNCEENRITLDFGDGEGEGEGGLSRDVTGCKRGVAANEHSIADLETLSESIIWWYNWTPRPEDPVKDAFEDIGVEFVPMVWNNDYDIDETVNVIPDSADYLLVFNEPNFFNQADMSAEAAAAAWPRAEEVAARKNLELVAPGLNFCGGGCHDEEPWVWLDKFFAACQGCKVDFISVHWYACDLAALEWYIGEFEKYGKPIWVTEFACHDGDRSLENQKKYMTEAVNYFENHPLIFRYAWFATRSFATESNLMNGSGELNELGDLYVSLPHNSACQL